MSDRELRIEEASTTFMPITIEFFVNLIGKDLSIEFECHDCNNIIATIPNKKVGQLIDFLKIHYEEMMK